MIAKIYFNTGEGLSDLLLVESLVDGTQHFAVP